MDAKQLNISRSSSSETMEDMIIKQYKEDIEKRNLKTKYTTSSTKPQSPYLQSVAPQNSSIFNKPMKQRPMSAKASLRRRYNSFEVSTASDNEMPVQITAEERKNGTDGDDSYSSEFDESSSEEHEEAFEKKENKLKKKKSQSSEKSRRIESDSSNDLSKPIFKRHNYVIKCTAYKNGSLDDPVRIAAPTIKQLLESATIKLGLITAARRVFLSDGCEAFRPQDIPPNSEVFVSRGEPFRDPFLVLRRQLNSASSHERFRRRINPPNLKRLNELVGKRTMRVLTFRNAEGSDSHEVVYEKPVHPERSAEKQTPTSPYESVKRKRIKAESMEKTEKKNAISFQKFLDGCTQRLGLNAPAKVLYNWKGDIVTHISQVEKIDSKLTTFITYGPVWVSKCEGFSPVGSQQYIEVNINLLKDRLHGAKLCQRDLALLENEQWDDVSNDEILNLEESRIPATKEKVAKDIEAFKTLLKKYKSRWRVLEEMVIDQRSVGASYTMKNIKEVESDDRMVGEHGLRVKVYDNGSDRSVQEVFLNMKEIQRGTKEQKLIRARFLEALTSWHKPVDPTGPARSSVIRRLFDRDGNEIVDVLKIQNDDEIWLSYGEDFKPQNTTVLSLQVEKASAVILQENNEDICKVHGEFLDLEELPEGSDKSNQWRATDGFPERYKFPRMEELSSIAKFETEKAITLKGYSSTDHYLQHKNDSSLVLRPNVKIDQKVAKETKWPKESQTWLINKSGKIYSRAFPNLALSIDKEKTVTVYCKDGMILDGFSVTLKKKKAGSDDWCFSVEGNIYSLQGMKQHILTYLDPTVVTDVKQQRPDQDHVDEMTAADLTPAMQAGNQPRETFTLAVVDKVKSKSALAPCQRWAIKQESVSNPCQWKKTKVANSTWRKLAYSWPVLPDGNWNDDYKWPMQGLLLPNVAAPSNRNRSISEDRCVRVRVCKNGESKMNRYVHVVAPDLTHMEKEGKTTQNRTNDTKQIVDLELTMFLEEATSLLGLGFAARRLFDENGKELFSVRSFKRDQVVYVSVGETWTDPRVTKSEQQRRQLLGKLTHDVAMMKAFCDIRDPNDLVIEAERGIMQGSRLIMRKCSLSSREREDILKGETNPSAEDEKACDEDSEESYPFASDLTSAHIISHLYSDKKHLAKQYPWQKKRREQEEAAAEKEEEEDKASPRRQVKAKKTKKGNPNQRFVFRDGFISPCSDNSLAFGVVGIDLDNLSGNVEVILCRKSIDDPVQQWELTEDGFIKLKCSSRLVLGVSMPAYKPGQDGDLTFENCSITVQNAKQYTTGRANQKWLYDPVLEVIQAFHSDDQDKEITAANHASICTCAVVGPEVISQDGSVVDLPSDSPVAVCSSCAKVIRGQYQLIKIPEKFVFTCAMGNARKTGIRQKGSFSCLNGKVDLSTYEAETTLHHWVSQLEKLRQETSLRLMNREIQSSTPIQACRVLAMRNGEGRLRQGEVIVGTSIAGILDQCTQRLALGAAARRLYTSDGMHVLHMEQLIEWAVRYFYAAQKEQKLILSDSKLDYERGEPEGLPVTVGSQKPEEGSNSREGTPDHSTAEDGIKVTTSDLAKKLRPPSGRRGSLTKRKPSTQAQDRVQEVPLAIILRNPIEVWVSCGENFVPPATAEKLYDASLKAQANRNADNLILDTEKHALRHMQGRRFKEMSPTNLKPTKAPKHPILVEGGWSETTKEEAVKLEKVHKLEEHLAEARPLPPHPKTKGINLNRELYRQSNRKRVMVYHKDESPQKAMYVWGESVAEILADATTRLGMHRRARHLYTEDGSRVSNFDSIERDSLLCVTSGDPLKGRPKQSNVNMKAEWARTRKEHGPEATEISISKTESDLDLTNVDPFGPPGLASFRNLALEGAGNDRLSD